MKVLFISSSPINKSVSIGNTFLNVFNGLDDIELASVYTRNGFPDVRISKAFCVTERMIIKGKNVGKEVFERYEGESFFDNGAVRFVKKKRWTVFFWLQNFIWKLPFWKSKKLKTFLRDYDANIIFTVLSDSYPLYKITKYICKYTRKPLVLYAWDDNYSMRTVGKSPFKRLNRRFNRIRMRKLVNKATKLYVISQIQKGEYEKWFKRECVVLTKAADFSHEPELKQTHKYPLQLVFTGNIGMNRWRSLALVANALKKLNQNGVKAQLKIYTGSIITDEIKNALSIEGTSYLMGSISANQVCQVQCEADILVHVEGLDKKSQIETRLSFSTKLVDYFKVARPILAVGPRGIASIEHLLDNFCAIVADNEECLYEKLKEAISDFEKLNDLAKKAYECGRVHHDISKKNKIIVDDLTSLVE